jgi:hypothetical protein
VDKFILCRFIFGRQIIRWFILLNWSLRISYSFTSIFVYCLNFRVSSCFLIKQIVLYFVYLIFLESPLPLSLWIFVYLYILNLCISCTCNHSYILLYRNTRIHNTWRFRLSSIKLCQIAPPRPPTYIRVMGAFAGDNEHALLLNSFKIE